MRKNGFTLMEMIIVIEIVVILVALAIPVIMRSDISDITVYISETNGKKTLVYLVVDRYDYKTLYFRDVGLDGTLDSVEDSHGLISTPNIIAVRSTPAARVVSWNTWMDRFEQEVRPRAVEN